MMSVSGPRSQEAILDQLGALLIEAPLPKVALRPSKDGARLRAFLDSEKDTPPLASLEKIENQQLLPTMQYFQGHIHKLSVPQQICLLLKLASYHNNLREFAQGDAAISQLERAFPRITNPISQAQLNLEKGRHFRQEKDYVLAIEHLEAARKTFSQKKLLTWEFYAITALIPVHLELKNIARILELKNRATKLFTHDEGSSYQSVLAYHLGRYHSKFGGDMQNRKTALEYFNESQSKITPYLERIGLPSHLEREKEYTEEALQNAQDHQKVIEQKRRKIGRYIR